MFIQYIIMNLVLARLVSGRLRARGGKPEGRFSQFLRTRRLGRASFYLLTLALGPLAIPVAALSGKSSRYVVNTESANLEAAAKQLDKAISSRAEVLKMQKEGKAVSPSVVRHYESLIAQLSMAMERSQRQVELYSMSPRARRAKIREEKRELADSLKAREAARKAPVGEAKAEVAQVSAQEEARLSEAARSYDTYVRAQEEKAEKAGQSAEVPREVYREEKSDEKREGMLDRLIRFAMEEDDDMKPGYSISASGNRQNSGQSRSAAQENLRRMEELSRKSSEQKEHGSGLKR